MESSFEKLGSRSSSELVDSQLKLAKKQKEHVVVLSLDSDLRFSSMTESEHDMDITRVYLLWFFLLEFLGRESHDSSHNLLLLSY